MIRMIWTGWKKGTSTSSKQRSALLFLIDDLIKKNKREVEFGKWKRKRYFLDHHTAVYNRIIVAGQTELMEMKCFIENIAKKWFLELICKHYLTRRPPGLVEAEPRLWLKSAFYSESLCEWVVITLQSWHQKVAVSRWVFLLVAQVLPQQYCLAPVKTTAVRLIRNRRATSISTWPSSSNRSLMIELA